MYVFKCLVLTYSDGNTFQITQIGSQFKQRFTIMLYRFCGSLNLLNWIFNYHVLFTINLLYGLPDHVTCFTRIYNSKSILNKSLSLAFNGIFLPPQQQVRADVTYFTILSYKSTSVSRIFSSNFS